MRHILLIAYAAAHPEEARAIFDKMIARCKTQEEAAELARIRDRACSQAQGVR